MSFVIVGFAFHLLPSFGPEPRLIRRDGNVWTENDLTVTFEDLNGKTRLTMTALFPTPEARNHVVEKYGAIEGGKQTLGRLADYLSHKT